MDVVPHIDMSDSDRAPLISNALGTRLDITAIVSLLASNQCSPPPGHLDAAKYVGKYVKATASYGLSFSSRRYAKLAAFVYFPLCTDEVSLTAFADANWGPQQASRPTS